MTNPTKGVVEVTGEIGTGKTTFCLECNVNPAKILLIDDDLKGRSTVEQLVNQGINFGGYIDLLQIYEMCKVDELYLKIKKLIEDIPSNKYDAIVWDTWTLTGKACREYAGKNYKLFRDKYAPNSKIKEGEQSADGRKLEVQLINTLRQKAGLVFLVAHLKDDYLNNVRTGKQVPSNTPLIDKVADMRIWIRSNPNSAVPIGLLMKRPNTKIVIDGRLRTVNFLPRKLTPRPDDQSLWDLIEWYYHNPVGNRMPTADEMPDEYELSILDGTLTNDQKMIMKIGASVSGGELLEQQPGNNLLDQIHLIQNNPELGENDKTPPAIANKLGVSVFEVLKAVNGA